MKILLSTLVSEPWSALALADFRKIYERDRVGVHQLTADPEQADAILMVDVHQHPADWRLEVLHRHPLMPKHAAKIFIYDERDCPWCAWPGIYVCMPRAGFDPHRQRAYSYGRVVNELMTPVEQEPDLLFSFQGALSHPVRAAVLALRHPRAVVEDPQFSFFGHDASMSEETYRAEVHGRKMRYQEIVSRSKFVLCPRGAGTSSFRLFETLAAGRVPVIISDEWVEPIGPDWDRCALRIPESQVGRILQILEDRETEFADRAAAALRTYREWFAPDVMFYRLAEQCAELLRHGRLGRQPAYFLRRQYLKNALAQSRSRLRALVRKRI